MEMSTVRGARLTRRGFLAGAAAIASTAILAACGGGATATDTPKAAAATTSAAVSPTSVAGTTASSSAAGPASAAPATIKRGGTLIIGADVSPVGLDPALTTAFASIAIYEQLYSSLLTLEYATNKVKPDLATSWKNVDDRTVEFSLRQGVKFHSGREVTADDVKYTIDRLTDPNVAVPLRSYLGPGATAEVVDKYTVRVKNSDPYAPLASVLADRRPTAIVDRDIVQKNGSLANWDGGSGPFKLVEYTPDVRVVLERNGDYYEKDLPILDRIEFHIIPDENARIAAIRAGEVDLTVVKDPKLVKTMRGDSNIVINEVPSFWRSGSAFNLAHKPLDDVRVRQAISYGVDRQELINTILLGDGAVTGVIPPGETTWAIPATPDNYPDYAYNPTKAQQLLKDAGAEGLKISIAASPAYAPDIPSAQVMQAQLKKIGIDLSIQQLEFAALLKNQTTGDFDMSLSFNTNRPDPDTYISPARSGVSANVGKYSNAQMDQLIDQGRATTDLEARKKVYADAQKLFASEVPILFTYVIKNYEPTRPRVKGYVPMASGYRLSLKETWISQ
jgi:peptide/nickel transport system substrate-binding protein